MEECQSHFGYPEYFYKYNQLRYNYEEIEWQSAHVEVTSLMLSVFLSFGKYATHRKICVECCTFACMELVNGLQVDGEFP